jgi:poly(3-hydroxybutyrate) depolymerase
MASSLTLVGLMRVSIGPAIKVMLRGCASSPSSAINAVLTVEGERDDICGLGQTLAAQELCTGLRQYMKAHHLQTGVGHYGVFSGRSWDNEVYPKVRDIIQMTD